MKKPIHLSQLATFADKLIRVDRLDNRLGSISKVDAHLMDTIKRGIFHRAFSVFIFDDQYRLLMQQRSSDKITFPLFWTNSCCSHPHDIREHYENEGCQRAAIQRVKFELGLDIKEPLHLVEKLIYQGQYDEEWGEYELDYVYFVRTNNTKLEPNKTEVESLEWVSQKDIIDFVNHKEPFVTPWFQKIMQNRLMQNWENFKNNDITSLTSQCNKISDFD